MEVVLVFLRDRSFDQGCIYAFEDLLVAPVYSEAKRRAGFKFKWDTSRLKILDNLVIGRSKMARAENNARKGNYVTPLPA